MKKKWFGIALLMLSVLARGDGEALYKRGTKVYKLDPAQAFGLFVQAAGAGNSAAMTGAGHCCETGTGTEIDYSKAIDWYKKAVQYNSLKACEGLARIYASCDDPEFHNGEESVKYANALVRKKPRDAETLALLAAAYARNMEFEKAVKVMHSARRSTPNELKEEYKERALKYAEGEPYPPKATEVWILRAADANALWAVDKLARKAADPHGGSYNPRLALMMFQKAIDAGNLKMYVQMGILHFDAGDLEKAYECYEAAYTLYYRPAKQRIPFQVANRYHLRSPPDTVFKRAEKYREGYETKKTTFVRSGVAFCSNPSCDGTTCHICYVSKEIVVKHPPDLTKCYILYEIAAKKGHREAKNALASMEQETNAYKRILKNEGNLDNRRLAQAVRAEAAKLEGNKEYPRNLELAAMLYEKSYELNPLDQVAYELGMCCLRDDFDLKIEKGIEWLDTAHSKGSSAATRMLIEIYAFGKYSTAWDGVKAVEYAEILIETNPVDHDAYRLLACAYARNASFMNAEKAMKKAVELLRESGNKSRYKKTQYEKQCHAFNRGEPWPPKKD